MADASRGATAAPAAQPGAAARLLERLRSQRGEMVALLERLVRIESPSLEPAAQEPMFAALEEALATLGFRIRRLRGRRTGGSLLARPPRRPGARAAQLLLGHCDTVWPLGTLASMPVRVAEDRLEGPGAYDMKGGLVQMLFALRALRELDLEPQLAPVVFVNSDEEIGSGESVHHVRRLARAVERVFVLEPSLGPDGRLKTARKGVGRFSITVRGKAAHAGLDPEAGVSAILELSHVVQELFALNDVDRGVSVNVGTIEGGLRPNVIAPESRAAVDARVLTPEDAARIEAAIRSLAPRGAEARIEVEGGFGKQPLQRTPRNRALWELAQRLGRELGIDLQEGTAGGGSDGNTTSLTTATLDGLGAVGEGAHAAHEAVFVERLPERAALLGLLLLAPPLGPEERP